MDIKNILEMKFLNLVVVRSFCFGLNTFSPFGMSPKQKDCTTNFKNLVIEYFQLVSYCVQKGEKVVFQKWYIKTLLNTKRRISFRGSFCLVKGKAFETGGENFKSWKCFCKLLFMYLWLFAKDLLKWIYKKNLQKQNMWCKRGPKYYIRKKQSLHIL